MAGGKIPELCSQTPLGAGESFTSPWIADDTEQMSLNIVSDQDGTLFVEFGIVKDTADLSRGASLSESDVVKTFPGPTGGTPVKGVTVGTGPGYFRSIVKMPGRAFRVRYVNGAVAQSEFYLLVAHGDQQFPPSTSDDNEVLTTVTERERGVFAAVSSGDISADAYRGFIDLSNTSGLPHDRDGRIDLTAVFISVDRDSTAAGSVRIGVITRIDGTDSDISYIQGVTFSKSDTRTIIRDRILSPNQLKCEVSGGELTKVASQFTETDVTAVNTSTSLTDANGNSYNPAVGDLIIKFSRSAGTYSSAVSCFYHGER